MSNIVKLRLIFISIGLILLDKYAYIGAIREDISLSVHEQIMNTVGNIKSYPGRFLLQSYNENKLIADNEDLQKKLNQVNFALKEQQNKSEDIHSLNVLPNKLSNFNTIVGKVYLDSNYFQNSKIMIDIGENESVAVGDAVINQEGVIGQISKVNLTTSEVSLIKDIDFKIFVKNSSNIKMLLNGTNIGLRADYIAKDTELVEGDILYTTGLDEVFPANIPVAKITQLQIENNGFNVALCSAIVDFNKIKYVLVVQHAK